jgi:Ca2+-binding EF-hand superfamily protein
MSDEATLRTKFDKFDADNNGYIDESEFGALVNSLGIEMSAEKVAVAFLAVDVNGNGRIEFGEFSGWWGKLRSR